MMEAARGGTWLGRLAAGGVVLALTALVVGWIPQDDVFVSYPKNCPPRTATFWPLVFVWVIGAFLLRTVLALPTGTTDAAAARPHRNTRTAHPLTWAFRGLLTAWTLACGLVLVNNVSTAVVWLSLVTAGKALGALLLLGLAIAAVVWPISLLGRRRTRRLRAEFEGMDEAARGAALECIDRHARRGEHLLLYRAAAVAADPGFAGARRFGVPVAPAGDVWPAAPDGAPARFLLQLPLAAPRLPPAWHGRILSAFLCDNELLVRSLADDGNLVPLTPPQEVRGEKGRTLEAVAIPYRPPSGKEESGDDDGAYEDLAESLLEEVPGLAPLLARHTRQPAMLLRWLLAGETQSGEGFTLVGGRPDLIQGPHDPVCPDCGKPMRFLCQFDDPTDDFAFGDAGVAYVYGCDTHPTQCQAFVDCY